MTIPDIKVDIQPWAPASRRYVAIDADSYQADCDEEGFRSTSLVGEGPTHDEAIADLLAQLEGT